MGRQNLATMKKYRFYLLLLLLSATILTVACTNDTPESEDPPLPDNYAYTVVLKCFCFPVGPFDIEMLNGEIISFESDQVDVEGLSDELKNSFTIDNLHGRVLQLLDQNPFMSTVIPHPVYGFPADVFIDSDERIADEEWGYTITEFRSL